MYGFAYVETSGGVVETRESRPQQAAANQANIRTESSFPPPSAFVTSSGLTLLTFQRPQSAPHKTLRQRTTGRSPIPHSQTQPRRRRRRHPPPPPPLWLSFFPATTPASAWSAAWPCNPRTNCYAAPPASPCGTPLASRIPPRSPMPRPGAAPAAPSSSSTLHLQLPARRPLRLRQQEASSSSRPSARSRPTPPSPMQRRRDAGKTFSLADLHPMMSTTAQRTASSTSSAKASAAPSAWSCWISLSLLDVLSRFVPSPIRLLGLISCIPTDLRSSSQGLLFLCKISLH